MMDLINPILNSITGMNGEALVVFILIINGYLFKEMTFFPNEWIPRLNFLLAPILCILVVQWPDPSDTWMQKVKFPMAAAWAHTLMKGVALFFVAWVLHNKVLKVFIDDKVPAMNPGMTKESKKVEETSVAESGEETKTVEKSEKTITVDPPPDAPKTDVEPPKT